MYAAILFDLLSGLLNSWQLFDEVAGDVERGRAWRRQYLALTYAAGRYRPYEELVAEAAEAVALPTSCAAKVIENWNTLEPWPEAPAVLQALEGRVPIGVVTNCSQALALQAVARTGVTFDVTVSAERAGCYKPQAGAYLMALQELDAAPERTLFVAGSPYDVTGASRVGMQVYWHDRIGLHRDVPVEGQAAIHDSLKPLLPAILNTARPNGVSG